MAHWCPLTVSTMAKKCLALWAKQTSGCKHRQSRRFLDPHYCSNDARDPGLRKGVEMLASGCEMGDLPPALRFPLAKWLSALKLVRVVERSVEGIHSLLKNRLKKAPAAKAPYLSYELRHSLIKPTLKAVASSDPQVTLAANANGCLKSKSKCQSSSTSTVLGKHLLLRPK